MQKIREFLNYQSKVSVDTYANKVHHDTEFLLKNLINEKNILNFRNNELSYFTGALDHPDKFFGYFFSRGIIKNYVSSILYLYKKKKKN